MKPAMDSKVSNSRRVQIVYYLSRRGQLEHPHLLELSISSTEGLYLRDVKKRLTTIRGNRMPTSFAWSYKRSYKNGYVWQDLCDDDMIFPAHGCEYVLKGSEILDKPPETGNYTVKSGAHDGKNEQKGPCQEAVVSLNSIAASKQMMREKATEVASSEHENEAELQSSHRSHETVNVSQLDADGANKTDHRVATSSLKQDNHPQRSIEKVNLSSDESLNTRKLHEYKVFTKQAATVMVENGTDAATQTEEQEKRKVAKSSTGTQALTRYDGKNEDETKPTELRKDEVSPPPLSSSSSSPSRSTTAAGSPPSSDRSQGKAQSSTHRGQEDTLDRSMASNPSSEKKSAKAHGPRRSQNEWPFVRSKTRNSSASGLLQFVSCGGLDIKEEIIPMSLYLKANGAHQPSAERFCELLRSGQDHSRCRLGKKNASKPRISSETPAQGVRNNLAREGENNAEYSGALTADHRLRQEAALPDVISISRTSFSERSSELSRELDCHSTELHRPKGDGELRNSPNSAENNSTKRDADLATKVSPRTPLKNHQVEFTQEFTANTSRPSEQVEEGSERQIKKGNCGEKGYKNMALLWEQLLAPKRDFKNRDEWLLPPERSKADWERTLQNAVDLSLPPPDFYQLLQECLHCGRKFRPESLKVHSRSCNAQKSCKPNQLPGDPACIQSRIVKASPLNHIV